MLGGCCDRRALGQFVVHKEDRRVRVREELLFDLTKPPITGNGHHQKQHDNQPSGLQRKAQDGPISAEQWAGIGVIAADFALLEEVMAQKRGYGQRQDPRQHQRDANHGEEGEEEFPRRIGTEPDPGKGHDADDRCAQERDLRFASRFIRRVARGFAPPHRDLHPLGDHNGVIHQHPHGDDQRAKGNPLHFDGEDRHEEKRANNREQQG